MTVLPNIIGEQQFGFLKGRFIGCYNRLISDIMTVTKNKNVSAMLIALDFEKAFDSLNWNFIMKAL